MLSRSRLVAIAVSGAALLATAPAANAAIVANGDFETGNFSGWTTANSGLGFWQVYSGTTVGPGPFTVPAPPSGTFGAITVQNNVSNQFLYQDVTVPPGGSVNQLSLFAYYSSSASMVSPDTLSTSVPNQQYRIDVMKPGAPIDSVASGDILLTVFRTLTGDPTTVAPTQKTADLTPFAGQTVRLRFAAAVTVSELNAGTDAVAIKSNGFSIGKAKLDKNRGTAKLPVTVPDPGTLKLSGKGVKGAAASKSVSVRGGTVKLLVKAKGKTQSKLNNSGKAKVKLKLTYTPNGLSSNTEKTKVKLKKT
jgi:hypothetical protein